MPDSANLNVIIPSIAVGLVFLAIIIGGLVSGLLERRKKQRRTNGYPRHRHPNVIYTPQLYPLPHMGSHQGYQSRQYSQYPELPVYMNGYHDRNNRYEKPQYAVRENYYQGYPDIYANGGYRERRRSRSPTRNSEHTNGHYGGHRSRLFSSRYPNSHTFKTDNYSTYYNHRPKRSRSEPKYSRNATQQYSSNPWPSQTYYKHQEIETKTRKRGSRSVSSQDGRNKPYYIPHYGYTPYDPAYDATLRPNATPSTHRHSALY